MDAIGARDYVSAGTIRPAASSLRVKACIWKVVVPGCSGCESCHGPVEKHVNAVRAGDPAGARLPHLGALSAEEMSDLCGRCHRTWSQIALNGPRGVNNVRFQPYRLANSKCFNAEDRRIRCTACHDPHGALETNLASYDAKCAACHSTASATATEANLPRGESQLRRLPHAQSRFAGRPCPLHRSSNPHRACRGSVSELMSTMPRRFSTIDRRQFLIAGATALARPRRIGAEPRPLFEEVPAETSGIRWVHENAASAEHYLPETMGPGCAFLDYDNDGWMDIFLVNSGPCDFFKPRKPIANALYKNTRDGSFTDVTAKAGVAGNTFGMGVAVGDYDNDGLRRTVQTAYGRPDSLSQQRQRHLQRC